MEKEATFVLVGSSSQRKEEKKKIEKFSTNENIENGDERREKETANI